MQPQAKITYTYTYIRVCVCVCVCLPWAQRWRLCAEYLCCQLSEWTVRWASELEPRTMVSYLKSLRHTLAP